MPGRDRPRGASGSSEPGLEPRAQSRWSGLTEAGYLKCGRKRRLGKKSCALTIESLQVSWKKLGLHAVGSVVGLNTFWAGEALDGLGGEKPGGEGRSGDWGREILREGGPQLAACSDMRRDTENHTSSQIKLLWKYIFYSRWEDTTFTKWTIIHSTYPSSTNIFLQVYKRFKFKYTFFPLTFLESRGFPICFGKWQMLWQTEHIYLHTHFSLTYKYIKVERLNLKWKLRKSVLVSARLWLQTLLEGFWRNKNDSDIPCFQESATSLKSMWKQVQTSTWWLLQNPCKEKQHLQRLRNTSLEGHIISPGSTLDSSFLSRGNASLAQPELPSIKA